MPVASAFNLIGKRAVLATMHGKERVIRPLLATRLKLEVSVPAGFDTDQFGTFTGEVKRAGSQLAAARAKIAAAFDHDPAADIAVASEGSFGPNPQVFFAPIGYEIVVMSDRRSELELIGYDTDISPAFAHETTLAIEQGIAFAKRLRFPHQGIIVAASIDGRPDPASFLRKDLRDWTLLQGAIHDAVQLCGAAHLATDMRAHAIQPGCVPSSAQRTI